MNDAERQAVLRLMAAYDDHEEYLHRSHQQRREEAPTAQHWGLVAKLSAARVEVQRLMRSDTAITTGDLLVFMDTDVGRWWVQVEHGWQLAEQHADAERLLKIRDDNTMFDRQPTGLFVVTAEGGVIHPDNYRAGRRGEPNGPAPT
jgi:hypothetical protein